MMTDETRRQIEWLLVTFEIDEGVTGIYDGMLRPSVFTDDEWRWVLDTSAKIMAEGGKKYAGEHGIDLP